MLFEAAVDHEAAFGLGRNLLFQGSRQGDSIFRIQLALEFAQEAFHAQIIAWSCRECRSELRLDQDKHFAMSSV